MELDGAYMGGLKERAKKTRAYTKYQLVGLEIAEMLSDEKHKALYIKLAKDGNSQELRRLAAEVRERSGIDNKGAYFMKLWKMQRKDK